MQVLYIYDLEVTNVCTNMCGHPSSFRYRMPFFIFTEHLRNVNYTTMEGACDELLDLMPALSAL